MNLQNGERKLVAFLNLADLTPQMIDQAFEVEGIDLGIKTGESILAQRQQTGPFTDSLSVQNTKLIGNFRLKEMLARSAEGALDNFLPDEVAFQPLEGLPDLIHNLGGCLMSGSYNTIHIRLSRAAAIISKLESLPLAATQFKSAAEAFRDGIAPPPLTALSDFLQIPTDDYVLEKLPVEFRSDYLLLDQQAQRLAENLERVVIFGFIDAVGPGRVADLASALQLDNQKSQDLAAFSSHACIIAETALVESGFILQSIALQINTIMEPLLFLTTCMEKACIVGKTRTCSATDVMFVPKGTNVNDAEDFKNEINFLKLLGSLPKIGKVMTPGAQTMIKEIAKNLVKIKEASDKKLIRLDGYAVFVRLEYEECVEGFFGGTKWVDKNTVVEIDPPIGRKTHPIGKKGWAKKYIESLSKSKPKDVKIAFNEFIKLAEKKCP